MVFQDPYASLNPMQMVGSIVAEPIMNFSNKSLKSLKGEVMELLRKVGLPEDAYYKYAHEFSGGQHVLVLLGHLHLDQSLLLQTSLFQP